MIQAKDLRIGNFVKCKTSNDAGIYQVLALDGLHLKIYLNEPRNKWHTEDLIKPIPLTEEWLLKFGFEKASRDSSFYILMIPKKYQVYISISFEMDSQQVCQNGNGFNVDLKYVHQLQNLTFALTNEELTIKTD